MLNLKIKFISIPKDSNKQSAFLHLIMLKYMYETTQVNVSGV